MPARVIHVKDLPSMVGQELGQSEWHEVTQEQVNAFADATGDHQWIHFDPEAAKAGPFGGPIAHGYLTLSMVPMLSVEAWVPDGIDMAVNYGLNRLRLPAPVPVGSKVRLRSSLVSAKDRPDGMVEVATAVTIEVEGAAKPSCVAETVTLFHPA